MRRAARLRVGAALLVAGALAACTFDPLNPQPLPPGPDPQDGIGFGADAGAVPPPELDGGVLASPTTTGDAGADLDGGTPIPNAPDASAPDAGDAGSPDAGDGGVL